MYRHTFILGIVLKLLGQRCQCQICLNTESPRQNNPNKFPCGRKQITQGELSMRDHLFTHAEFTDECLCGPTIPLFPPLHWICLGGRNRVVFKDQKNTTCTLKLQFTWDLFSKGGLLWGGGKGSELCGANMVSRNPPPPPHPVSALIGSLRTAERSPH